MSTKIDCLVYLRTLLQNIYDADTGHDVSILQKIQKLILTADTPSLSEGYWNIIEPLYAGPQFFNAVKALNASVVSGDATPADFTAYVKLLATSLRS